MSDDNAGSSSGQTPPGGQHPPNWGNAYPPPQQPGQPQYPPPGYGQAPPGYGYPYQGQPVPPKHSQATTAMVFGIVSLAGMFACVLPIVLAPVAWILGAKAVKEIDANPSAYSGRSEATAGKILGIVGTALLVLVIAAVAIIVVIAFNGGFDDSYDSSYTFIAGIV